MITYLVSTVPVAVALLGAVATEERRHQPVPEPAKGEQVLAVARYQVIRRMAQIAIACGFLLTAWTVWAVVHGDPSVLSVLPVGALIVVFAGWWMPREARLRCRALGIVDPAPYGRRSAVGGHR